MKKHELLSQLKGFEKIKQPLPNMVEVEFENGSLMQSYETIIGVFLDGRYYFNADARMSRTTMKHTSQWCGMDLKTRETLADNPEISRVQWFYAE